MASLPQPDDEIDHVLRHIQENIRVLAYDGRGFVPRTQLREHLTRDRIEKLLDSCGVDSLNWKTIRTNYLSVFVILLLIDKAEYINHFTRHNKLSDAYLPFDNLQSWPSKCHSFFDLFDAKQWEFCAEEFTPDRLDNKEFDARSIIPITIREELKAGPDSWTYKIRIHPDYNHLGHVGTNVGQRSEYFVLKFCQETRRDLHLNEVRAYTVLSRHQDIANHIAHFHGCWRQGDTYNLLLEHVEGNTLADVFTEEHPTSEGDMLKFWTNVLRILDPVLRIHCHGDPADHNEVTQGAHQDIKPANILVTLSRSTSRFDRIFKLADLGLTYLPPEDKQHRMTRGRDIPGTQMFSAPECFRDEADLVDHRTSRPVDSIKDIWSLGCTFSEAVVWCVLGANGLKEYRERRIAATQRLRGLARTAYIGCFHDGKEVLAVVHQMHLKVRKARSAYDQIINDVLPIIEDMLLDVSLRPDARTVRARFNRALQIADDMLLPGPFQDQPDPPLPPFPPQTPQVGLGLLQPASPRVLPRMSPISNRNDTRPNSRTFLNVDMTERFQDMSIVSVVAEEAAPWVAHVARRSTDSETRTSNTPIQSSSSRYSQNMHNGSRVSSAPESSIRYNVRHLNEQSATPNSRNLSNGGESHTPIFPAPIAQGQELQTPRPRYTTISQVLSWSRGTRKNPCPVVEGYLESLRGTDQIFIVDNSASMQQYRHEVRDTFESLAYLVKKLDFDGIDLHFTTSPEHRNGHHRTGMLEVLAEIQYVGEGHMEHTLGKILENNNKRRLSRVLDLVKRDSNSGGKSIYVLTNGKWHGNDDSLCGIPELIKRVVRKMDTRSKLGIQFIQFGSDPIGTWRLKELDDNLKKRGVTMDIIDTEPYTGNVYKMLLGHLISTWDQAPTSPILPSSPGTTVSWQHLS